MLFSFYLVVKRLMITKNSVVKIKNLVVNHESRPVKSSTVLKPLFVLKQLTFYPDFCNHVGKRFYKKAKLNFKNMASPTGHKTFAIQILPNISISQPDEIWSLNRI